jgi:hypothetical protein
MTYYKYITVTQSIIAKSYSYEDIILVKITYFCLKLI